MRDWDSLTLAEQTLLRGGARNALPAWSPEHYSYVRSPEVSTLHGPTAMRSPKAKGTALR
ncbi:hypothetical protein ABH931_006217 [Streptacidiphilus sp. MAP12-33]